ncbi:serine/threonine-protein kinase [Candidatus Protofrankia californiensis]|uniref:serine/threonine-protein kinase n=1 Tax=Candidatus Protofrankia californiensis TaxID=1839754 RepID=UPI0010416F6F|nr:serine/threonine-protein kinase [Candidatus Protofrankia californiensis]
MPLSPLRPGDPATVGGFRLSARLGAGGMGVVYLGSDRAGRPAAVKVIRDDHVTDTEFRARFRREVRAATAVTGAFTARLLAADPDTDPPWLATEYIAGPSLTEVVTAEGPLGPDLLSGLAAGLAEALVAIHGAGVVHRDLKPANILLTDTGPKVIDFGIAAAADATVATRTGVGLGSPGYMAPEQITGADPVGPATDVYAWALTVLYAATGRPPFGTGRPDVVLYRAVHGEADTSGIPRDLLPAVTAALTRDPSRRPTAAALLGALLPGGDDPATATYRIAGQDWHALTARHPVPVPVPVPPPGAGRRRIHPVALAVSGVLLLGTTATGIGIALAGDGDTRGGTPGILPSTLPSAVATGTGPVTGGPAATTTPATVIATAAASDANPTPTSVPAAVPQFQGKVGHLAAAKPFMDFVYDHDTKVVLLDVRATADGNQQLFWPDPDYGGDDRPNFTLFGECGDLPPGETPGYEPAKECAGTVYRLAIDPETGAFFDYVQGFYYIKGYFWVSAAPGMHQGMTAVNLRAVAFKDLPK